MPQLFRPAASALFRLLIVLSLVAPAGAGVMLYAWSRSGAAWNVGQPAPQPIPFRHDLHTGTLGIACAYCHSFAERAADAGMPSAATCMTCHSQVWVGASVLEPLRTSLALNQPIAWTSVHRLPDYAYFHHGAHVAKGVACATCHGDMTAMPKTVRVHTLSMGWCLDCHREPSRYLGLDDAARFIGKRMPSPSDGQSIAELTEAVKRRLTDCDTCHH